MQIFEPGKGPNRYKVMLKDRTVFEADDAHDVRDWLAVRSIVAEDGKAYPPYTVWRVDGEEISDEVCQIMGLVRQARYGEIKLVGGPRDGHVVRHRIKADGTATIKTFRSYKVRGGKRAWYLYNEERDVYEFSELEQTR